MSEEGNGDDVTMDYRQTLTYSQNIRKRIVEEFVGGGKVPNDPNEVNLVLKALGDMDKTALQDRKNDIDQGNADTSKQVAEAMSEMINLQQNRNPFQRGSDGGVERSVTPELQPPEVDVDKLGKYEIVKGETEVGVISESYTEFMARMDREKEDAPQKPESEE